MKTMTLKTFGFAFALALAGTCVLNAAQPFDSGSTGSYGAMNITTNTTLDMPPDGVFHCTTVSVATNVTLQFRRNALNTPVYLLAQDDVQIDGIIDLSGELATDGMPGLGGAGGFDGGFAEFGLAPAGDGKGPGAGNASKNLLAAAFARPAGYPTLNTNTYGNASCVPLVGGSGGAGAREGGCGGGGAILIASTTRIRINGTVRADGGGVVNRGGGGGGSGGAIRLVSPLVAGNGDISCNGGASYVTANVPASLGRIRIDCVDRYSFRSLRFAGVTTRGTQMFVFPAYNPRLDIIEAAGRPIPVGTTNVVSFELPPGPSTNITVRVQASSFTNNVPVRIVVTPENGPSASFDATIDISQGNPASTNVTVTLPAGTISTIHAWTR